MASGSGPGVRSQSRGQSLSFPSDAPRRLSLSVGSSCPASRARNRGSVSWVCDESAHPKACRTEEPRRFPLPAESGPGRKRLGPGRLGFALARLLTPRHLDKSIRPNLAGGKPPDDHSFSADGEPSRVRLEPLCVTTRGRLLKGARGSRERVRETRLLLEPKQERGPA